MWFTTSTVPEKYDGEPSGWKSSEKVEPERVEDNDFLHSDPVFLWDQNILPSFIKEGKKEKASQTGMAKVFFYSPTTSLLPPSERFRMEKKDHLLGRIWGLRGRK